MTEAWLPIPDYEDRYLVSDLGNVMALNYQRRGKPQLLVLSKHPHGYFRVTLTRDGKCKPIFVHVLVMRAFVGPRPLGCRDINHISGVKTDNRLDNLEYCTQLENSRHAARSGLYAPAHGENHYNARLKVSDLIEIKRKLREGVSQASIAKEYGIDPSHVSRISTGRARAREMRYLSAKQELLRQ